MRTKLGTDVDTGKEIWVSDKERRRGMYILGVPGSGKSAFIVHLVCQDIKKGYGTIVVDSHGDLLRYVIALLPPERIGKTYLLDLADTEYPLSLNLFSRLDVNELDQTMRVERVMHIFERRWPDIKGVLLDKMLRYITLTFAEHQGCTLADIPRLLRDDAFRANLVKGLRNEEVKAYWLYEYNAMTPGERRKETMALNNRIAALLTTPTVRNIVCQRRSTLDIRRAIEEREVLLVNLPKRLEEHAALIGTILLADIHAATFSFADMDWDKRPGYSLFLDEFQTFATSDIAELFKEGRKYGARITLAHQDRHDLASENRSATMTASTIACFQTTVADAMELAPIIYDADAKLRPERIYHDIIPRLRRHERQDIQDFYARYVRPLLQTNLGQPEGQEIVEILQELLYQSIKTRTIHEQHLEAYLQLMFPVVELSLAAPLHKRQQLHDQLQQREQIIERLQSYLDSERTLQEYLSFYYTYHSVSSPNHTTEQYGQPIVAADNLLADTAYWTYVLSGRPQPMPKRPEEMLKDLERSAVANSALSNRDTPQKIIAQERARIAKRGQELFASVWEHIAALHKLKSEDAEIKPVREFHFEMYRVYLATPLEQKPAPVFVYPAESRRAGNITDRTHLKDLIAQSLPFDLSNSEVAASWLLNEDLVYPLGGGSTENKYSKAQELWRTIVQISYELQQTQQLLRDETALLRAYYMEKALPEAVRELHGGKAYTDVWDMVRKEAHQNAWLASQQNTVEKLIQQRKNELRRKISQLIEEQETYKATLPTLEREIEAEIAAIDQQRAALRTSIRRTIQTLIDDPGPLGEKRTPRVSDTIAKLLNLPPRQAMVRVSESLNQQPHKYTMRTPDLPQAAKKEEVERRLHIIREQTRAKYCRPRREVEMELRDASATDPGGENEPREDEGPDSWYEEEE